jgi:hypothetical protein
MRTDILQDIGSNVADAVVATVEWADMISVSVSERYMVMQKTLQAKSHFICNVCL